MEARGEWRKGEGVTVREEEVEGGCGVLSAYK